MILFTNWFFLFFVFSLNANHVIDPFDDDFVYFWHLTDYHLDYEYKTDFEPYCVDYTVVGMCCRRKYDKQIGHAGKYGSPASPECDLPNCTYFGVLDFIRNFPLDHSKVLAVLSTGDFAAHDKTTQTQELNLDHVLNGYKSMYEQFSKDTGIIVIPSLGNHDTFPLDQLDYQPKGGWLLNPVGDLFGKYWLSEEEVASFKENGCFSHLLPNNIRVISINGMFVDSDNKKIVNSTEKRHLVGDWMKNEFKKVKENDEKAIILSHFSPGCLGPPLSKQRGNPIIEKFHVFEEWNQDMLNISYEYADNILMQLYGHGMIFLICILFLEHVDRYLVIKDPFNQEIPTSVGFVGPSVTTLPFSNPSVRLFKYNIKTRKLDDMITYINDVKKSNKEGSMENNWRVLYSAKEAWNVDEISPKNFQRVIDTFDKDQDNYNLYEYFHFSGFINDTCQNTKYDNCKTRLLCSMNYISKEKYNDCVDGKI